MERKNINVLFIDAPAHTLYIIGNGFDQRFCECDGNSEGTDNTF